jgi:(E)-4-hydroxy-3-methylbut-2-enyl-diphosphate synthase
VAALFAAGVAGGPRHRQQRRGRAGRPRDRAAPGDRGSTCPIVGDFHYNGHLLLTKYPECAAALAKYRINPGNVGTKHRDENFTTIVQAPIDHDKPVRIGVNWGSLDQDLLTEMMDANAQRRRTSRATRRTSTSTPCSRARCARPRSPRRWDCRTTSIIVSAKISQVQDLVECYRRLARAATTRCTWGSPRRAWAPRAIVASAAALGILLQEGIGDTIRVSLTPKPGGDRTRRGVRRAADPAVAGLRSFAPQVTACPGCGRTTSTFFQKHGRGHPGLPARADARVARRAPRAWRR